MMLNIILTLLVAVLAGQATYCLVEIVVTGRLQ